MSTLNVRTIDFSTGVAIKSQAVNTQTGTTYTFVGDDAGKLVSAFNASAVTFTVSPQSSVSWGANTVLKVVNYGAGALTVNGGSGVTVTNTARTLAQFESAACIRTAENAWTVVVASGVTLASATANVNTSQTTTSSTFTDLATVGPQVTLTTGTKVLICMSSVGATGTASREYGMSVAISGATTLAASDVNQAYFSTQSASQFLTIGRALMLTGLTAGSNTFTIKYRSSTSATATFRDRHISVIDLGS